MARKGLTPQTVPDDAYDATSWNGSTEVPTKNAIRDKIETMGGGGDVVGPASATDNAVARYDGTTGKLIQDSSVTILDSGDVGIGTTSPQSKFHVDGGTVRVDNTSTNSTVVVNRTDGKAAALSAGTNGGIFLYDNSGNFAIRSQSSENVIAGVAGGSVAELVVDGGNIGMGTASPSEKLDVVGNAEINGNIEATGKVTVGQEVEITDGITAPSATAGKAKLYIDSADGNLKIVFGDGTVKTIATDT